MRLIDADALKDKLQQHHDFYVMAWGGFGKMPIGEKKRVDEITNCIAEVVNAPTIEPKQGEMETVEVAYFCDRNKCERCNPLCDLTRDKEHAATTEKLVVLDGVSEMRGGWIPCTKRLPDEGEVVLVCMIIERHKAEWEEQRGIEFGRISSDRYDCYGTGWEWLNESGADYWQADFNNSIIAWMPLPKPWKGADDDI